MARVSHFEITADNPKRAAEFYEKAFGWKFTDWGGPFTYLLATTGDKSEIGIDGAIMDHEVFWISGLGALGLALALESLSELAPQFSQSPFAADRRGVAAISLALRVVPIAQLLVAELYWSPAAPQSPELMKTD